MIQEKRDIQRKLPFYFSFNLGWKGIKDLKVVLLKRKIDSSLGPAKSLPTNICGKSTGGRTGDAEVFCIWRPMCYTSQFRGSIPFASLGDYYPYNFILLISD